MWSNVYTVSIKLKISILSYSFVQKVSLNCLLVSQVHFLCHHVFNCKGSWPTEVKRAVLCVSSSCEEHPARSRRRGAAPTQPSVHVACSASRWRSRHVQPLQTAHGDWVTSGSSLNERAEGGMSSSLRGSIRSDGNNLQGVLTPRIVTLK